MEGGGAMLNAFFAGIGVSLNLPEALASGGTITAWEWFNATIWPLMGVVWGIAIIWYSAKTITSTDRQAVKAILPHVLLLVMSTAWIMAAHGL